MNTTKIGNKMIRNSPHVCKKNARPIVKEIFIGRQKAVNSKCIALTDSCGRSIDWEYFFRLETNITVALSSCLHVFIV